MKSPNFENCQVAINYEDGKIIEFSKDFSNWLGLPRKQIINQVFRQLMNQLSPQWERFLFTNCQKKALNIFLPIESDALGVSLSLVPYKKNGISVASITPALAPHDSLKNAFHLRRCHLCTYVVGEVPSFWFVSLHSKVETTSTVWCWDTGKILLW